jgi:hypothetical protein
VKPIVISEKPSKWWIVFSSTHKLFSNK